MNGVDAITIPGISRIAITGAWAQIWKSSSSDLEPIQLSARWRLVKRSALFGHRCTILKPAPKCASLLAAMCRKRTGCFPVDMLILCKFRSPSSDGKLQLYMINGLEGEARLL